MASMYPSYSIGDVKSAEHKTCRIQSSGEPLSESAELTSGAGLRSLVVRHEILAPGRRASSPHWHSAREEMAVVLRGTLTAVVGKTSVDLAAGQYIVFPPGEKLAHSFLNGDSLQDAEFLLISSECGVDDITYA